MIKYEIIANRLRCSSLSRNIIEQGCTLKDFTYEAVIAECFDSLDDAKKAFEKYETLINTIGQGKLLLYDVTEFYLQRTKYDNENNFCQCDKIYAFSPIIIRLVETDTQRIVRTLDSMKKAVEVKAELERKNKNKEYYFSYNL